MEGRKRRTCSVACPGIGSSTTPVEHRLRPRLHPDRSSRRRTVTTYYADDTLLFATGRGWAEVRERAETGVFATVEDIRGIGLRVSPPKTKACGFHFPRNPRPRCLVEFFSFIHCVFFVCFHCLERNTRRFIQANASS